MEGQVILMLKDNHGKKIPQKYPFAFYCKRVYHGGERDIHFSTLLHITSWKMTNITSFVLQNNFTCKLKSHIVHGSEIQKYPCFPNNVNSKIQGSFFKG